MRAPFALLRHGLRDRAGVAAVEFAVIAPLLITLLGAAFDLGTAVERSIRLENAARTAAQYVTRSPGAGTSAQGTAVAALTGPGWGGASVTVSAMFCTCPPAGAAVGGATVGCGDPCATGMARYFTVTATRPFAPLFPISAYIPSASTAIVVARVQ